MIKYLGKKELINPKKDVEMIREKYKEGDKSKGICDTCKKIVDVTFRKGEYVDGKEKFKDILQSYCDTCGSSVMVTHKGAVEINKQRKP